MFYIIMITSLYPRQGGGTVKFCYKLLFLLGFQNLRVFFKNLFNFFLLKNYGMGKSEVLFWKVIYFIEYRKHLNLL